MESKLKKTYFFLLIPVVFGFSLVYLLKTFQFVGIDVAGVRHVLAPVIFVFSVVFALALPILFRTLFAHKMRHRQSISENEWLAFERRFLYMSMVAPYLALLGYLFELPKFHLSGAVLMALYAVYFYYPSQKRVAFERRIFRVR